MVFGETDGDGFAVHYYGAGGEDDGGDAVGHGVVGGVVGCDAGGVCVSRELEGEGGRGT